MSDAKPKSPNAEQLAKELQNALAQRRPRPWKTILAALALSTLTLLVTAWLMYPRPAPAPLQVLALDVLATTDEDLQVKAQLLTPANATTARSLHKHKVVFHQPPAIFQGADKPREITGVSDERGQAAVDWDMPKSAIAEYQASYLDPAAKPARHTDHARIFVRPARTPLLVVDADETLKPDDVQASATLSNAFKDGWQIVYLALDAATPGEFQQARARLAHLPKLPRGPILGRVHAPGADSAEAARRELLQSIKTRFRGPIQAFVSGTASAQCSKEAGVSTILIGGAEAPAGVVRVASWREVHLRLD